VIKAPYIYEYDFKGFFDQISHDKLLEALVKRGMSGETLSILKVMLKSIPKFPRELLKDEPDKDIHFKAGLYPNPEMKERRPVSSSHPLANFPSGKIRATYGDIGTSDVSFGIRRVKAVSFIVPGFDTNI
jgi:hypothetical protein